MSSCGGPAATCEARMAATEAAVAMPMAERYALFIAVLICPASRWDKSGNSASKCLRDQAPAIPSPCGAALPNDVVCAKFLREASGKPCGQVFAAPCPPHGQDLSFSRFNKTLVYGWSGMPRVIHGARGGCLVIEVLACARQPYRLGSFHRTCRFTWTRTSTVGLERVWRMLEVEPNHSIRARAGEPQSCRGQGMIS